MPWLTWVRTPCSAALAGFLLAATCTGCGGGSVSGGPAPVPATAVAIDLPADSYMHPGAPTEWWWHTGTLRAGERIFGFEITAGSFQNGSSSLGTLDGSPGIFLTQVMLSDLANARHLQRSTVYLTGSAPALGLDDWAQEDVTKDWSVTLGSPADHLSGIDVMDPGSGYTSDPVVTFSGGGGTGALAQAVRDGSGHVESIILLSPGQGYTSVPTVTLAGGGGSGAAAQAYQTYVDMAAPWGETLTGMKVQAQVVDEATHTPAQFDLTFSQQGPPFIVNGTGVSAMGGQGTHLETNNYYYSLTRLRAEGSLTLDGRRIPVQGVTWMDHQYGAFGDPAHPVKWMLQDVQLDNGVCLSNYLVLQSKAPPLGQRTPSQATIQLPDGTTYFVPTWLTFLDPTWTSPSSGKTYPLQILVEIPAFDAVLTVQTQLADQEFPVPGADVYEGVATAFGTFQDRAVTGTAWNEQEPF